MSKRKMEMTITVPKLNQFETPFNVSAICAEIAVEPLRTAYISHDNAELMDRIGENLLD